MILTITTTYQPATDLGFLLHKKPSRCLDYDLSFGKIHFFYPEAAPERCTAALLLDVDPVGMVRRKAFRGPGLLAQYVNDRPYVASSFLSVAIAKVFGSALQGKCPEKPGLAEKQMPFLVKIDVLPARGGEGFLRRIFEPLGYMVRTRRHTLDGEFPEWGESPYYSLELEKKAALAEILNHLYVLVPVLDNFKHYYISQPEVEKLLEKGRGWLAGHPEREIITRRYLKFQRSLAGQALARLAEEEGLVEEEDPLEETGAEARILPEEETLQETRIGSVLAVLEASEARSVLDLGCGEGKLLRELLKIKRFERILGMDVSIRALERARERLKLDRLPPRQRERIALAHGSLMYRDARLEGYDAAVIMEVVEHMDPPRLRALERVVFQCARPRTVVLTTPNREYNVRWENVGKDRLRHPDHRFEWTRAEFAEWAKKVSSEHGYRARFLGVGPEDPQAGPPTQMGVFTR